MNRRVFRYHDSFGFGVCRRVREVDQIRLSGLGKGRRRIAGGREVNTADIQPFQHLRASREFHPAYGDALFFKRLIEGATILKQGEDIGLLIANVHGFRRLSQRGRRQPEQQRQRGQMQPFGHDMFSFGGLP